MCLYLIDPTLHTADKDIKVYKIIYLYTSKSLYKEFQYEPNTLYRLRKALKIEIETRSVYDTVHRGFHSYSSIGVAVRNIPFHSKVVEFTIPKGAKYFNGMNGELVSTSIRSGPLTPVYYNC